MTQKFGRTYRITIDPQDGGAPIIIALPFTIRFALNRDIFSALNSLSLDIYNLAPATRDRLYQDRYIGGGLPKNITFEAGYGTLYKIYDGVVFRASSAREGTNIVTRIECLAGRVDVASAQVYTTLQSGQTLGGILLFLMNQFTDLKPGAIGDFPEVFNRPVVLNGSVWELLKKYSNNNCFIDNGKIYCLKDAEVVAGDFVINDASGILETPRRDLGYLQVSTLLEAGADMKQKVKLQSSIQRNYDGDYSIIGIQHRGTISAAVSGDCRTVFKLLAPNQFGKFKTVQPL